jgi:TPR repeat protein
VYERLADSGGTSGVKDLGLCFRQGMSFSEDEAKSVEMYSRVAEMGHITQFTMKCAFRMEWVLVWTRLKPLNYISAWHHVVTRIISTV